MLNPACSRAGYSYHARSVACNARHTMRLFAHRFGASELHVVAAVMGGMAAQEAIKLITRQFVPFPGALIYNAMASTTSVIEL